MTRLLLLVPAITYRAADFLLAANKMGLDVVVGSDGALPLGDRSVVRVDPKDMDASVNRLIASSGRFDAVVAVDTDMLVLAARVAARLGLPHNTVDAINTALNKAEQRRRWAAIELPQPAFRVIPAETPESAVMRMVTDVGYPCVLKPLLMSGSRGVLRVSDALGAANAVQQIRRLLAATGPGADQTLLVEEYVPGPELSVDGVLNKEGLTVTAVFDKPDTPDGPTFEETLLVTPSRLPERILSATLSAAESAARALGLRHGPIHAEFRIDARGRGDQPIMIELAARSIGGLCSRALRFLDGMSLEEVVLANALGRDVSPRRADRAVGVLMLPVEQPGVLRGVEGKREAAAVDGITGLSITISAGEVITPLPLGDRYLGFIFAEGDTCENVCASLRTARSKLNVVIERSKELIT